jgi:PAS domain-containing protein
MSIVHKEGRRVHLNLTAIPIVVGGRIEGVYGVAHDVTRRRTSERSLEESDERYRAFIENSSEAIWRFEMELPIPIDRSEEEQIEHFYRYCYLAECNDAMARMYGFERAEEVIGKRLGEFLSRDNAANIEYLKAFIRSGYRLTDAESQEFDKNANQRYFLNNLIGIVKNGLVQRAWGTQRDVTDRRRADELQTFLVSASAVLGSSLDYETTLRNVARLAVPFFADCCIVDIALDESVQRVAIAHRDQEKEVMAQEMRHRYPYDPNAHIGVPKVLRTGEAEMFSHISLSLLQSAAQDADHLRILREVGLRSYICVPMTGRGQTVGAISFITAESGYHYTQNDLRVAEDIGRRAGIAIENAHLYHEAQQAREEAERARASAEAAQTEAERANRAKDEFSPWCRTNCAHRSRRYWAGCICCAPLAWTLRKRNRRLKPSSEAHACKFNSSTTCSMCRASSAESSALIYRRATSSGPYPMPLPPCAASPTSRAFNCASS